jgi:hypothetical protein
MENLQKDKPFTFEEFLERVEAKVGITGLSDQEKLDFFKKVFKIRKEQLLMNKITEEDFYKQYQNYVNSINYYKYKLGNN